MCVLFLRILFEGYYNNVVPNEAWRILFEVEMNRIIRDVSPTCFMKGFNNDSLEITFQGENADLGKLTDWLNTYGVTLPSFGTLNVLQNRNTPSTKNSSSTTLPVTSNRGSDSENINHYSEDSLEVSKISWEWKW